MRRTKIVATIGPASREPEVLARMVEAGMDVARLNYSHGSLEEHAETAARVRAAAARVGRPVAILQDLPGPKLRIGAVQDGLVELTPGETLTFECGREIVGDSRRMSVTWKELAESVEPGAIIYLADGAVRLRVQTTRPQDGELDAEIEIGGTVVSRQGLNIPGPIDRLPAVPQRDLELLAHGESIGVDLVALSFVRSASDIEFVRERTRLPLVAKIEKPQAVENAEAVLKAADCVMVARGDLGIELAIEDVPLVQKRLLRLAGALARPSITATQMLDSMVHSSRPTRAEVADVANAILDGTDAVMLSQETAVGAHPVGDARDPAYTVAYSACVAARELELDALVVPTLSGRSARLVSAHRPNVPIYALSPGHETVQRCGLMWGVQAAWMRRHEVTEELLLDSVARVVELGWIKPGQRVGITAGLPSGVPGTTSMLQIHRV